jgi:hypothetical protein
MVGSIRHVPLMFGSVTWVRDLRGSAIAGSPQRTAGTKASGFAAGLKFLVGGDVLAGNSGAIWLLLGRS